MDQRGVMFVCFPIQRSHTQFQSQVLPWTLVFGSRFSATPAVGLFSAATAFDRASFIDGWLIEEEDRALYFFPLLAIYRPPMPSPFFQRLPLRSRLILGDIRSSLTSSP